MTEALMAFPAAADAFQSLLARAPDCERLLPRAAALLDGVAAQVAAADEAAEEQGVGRPQPRDQQQQQSLQRGRWDQACAVAVADTTADATRDPTQHLADALDFSQVSLQSFFAQCGPCLVGNKVLATQNCAGLRFLGPPS